MLAFPNLKRRLENEKQPLKMAAVRTDSEPLWATSEQWKAMLEREGLRPEQSAPYRQGQNGVVERLMRTIKEAAKAMMAFGEAPTDYWEDAFRFGQVCRNGSPTKANLGRATPNDIWEGISLGVNALCLSAPLFCLATAYIYDGLKLDDNGQFVLYLGMDEVCKAYIVESLSTRRVFYSRDVRFFPTTFPFRTPMPQQLRLPALPGAGKPVAEGVLMPHDQHDDVLRSSRIRTPSVIGLESAANLCSTFFVEHYSDESETYFNKLYGPDPETWGEALAGPLRNNWIKADLDEANSLQNKHRCWILVLREQWMKVWKWKKVLKIKMLPLDAEHPQGLLDKVLIIRETIDLPSQKR